jgi:inorganic pyrophosphatase
MYELDKSSGHLRVDRPQRFSSMCPAPYGFIPHAFCGVSVAELCESRTGRECIRGDSDPLDICVLTERPAAHGDFIVRAIPIGGLRNNCRKRNRVALKSRKFTTIKARRR